MHIWVIKCTNLSISNEKYFKQSATFLDGYCQLNIKESNGRCWNCVASSYYALSKWSSSVKF